MDNKTVTVDDFSTSCKLLQDQVDTLTRESEKEFQEREAGNGKSRDKAKTLKQKLSVLKDAYKKLSTAKEQLQDQLEKERGQNDKLVQQFAQCSQPAEETLVESNRKQKESNGHLNLEKDELTKNLMRLTVDKQNLMTKVKLEESQNNVNTVKCQLVENIIRAKSRQRDLERERISLREQLNQAKASAQLQMHQQERIERSETAEALDKQLAELKLEQQSILNQYLVAQQSQNVENIKQLELRRKEIQVRRFELQKEKQRHRQQPLE